MGGRGRQRRRLDNGSASEMVVEDGLAVSLENGFGRHGSRVKLRVGRGRVRRARRHGGKEKIERAEEQSTLGKSWVLRQGSSRIGLYARYL